MQVSLLGMNAGIGSSVAQSTELEHANALLGQEVAELSSGVRIEEAAVAGGLVSPDAGDVGFLTARGGIDAERAVDNMTAPSATSPSASSPRAALRRTRPPPPRPRVEAETAPVAPVPTTPWCPRSPSPRPSPSSPPHRPSSRSPPRPRRWTTTPPTATGAATAP